MHEGVTPLSCSSTERLASLTKTGKYQKQEECMFDLLYSHARSINLFFFETILRKEKILLTNTRPTIGSVNATRVRLLSWKCHELKTKDVLNIAKHRSDWRKRLVWKSMQKREIRVYDDRDKKHLCGSSIDILLSTYWLFLLENQNSRAHVSCFVGRGTCFFKAILLSMHRIFQAFKARFWSSSSSSVVVHFRWRFDVEWKNQFSDVYFHSQDSKDSFPGDSRSTINRFHLESQWKENRWRQALATAGLRRLYSFFAGCDSGRYRLVEVQ